MCRGLVVAVLAAAAGRAAAQGCPNTAGVIAGSVLVTAAVLGAVLVIVAFVFWRKNKKREESKGAAPSFHPDTGHVYDNPTFHGDTEVGNGRSKTPGRMLNRVSSTERGYPGYVPCQEYGSPNEKRTFGSLEKNGTPSKWVPNLNASHAGVNMHPVHKTGSHSSLDDTCTTADPEVINVSLQSQDIIGLGFNISGSMRDGIYVSQVHNRGPASESGLLKAGDRILSITISFENMVYEDALTILSYASPYPVQLQVRKVNSGKLSAGKASPESNQKQDQSVLHPVYRSQSMDDVSQLGKESFSFRIRRARSEMKRGSSSKAKEREQEREEGKLRKWCGKQDVAVERSPNSETSRVVRAESSNSHVSIPDLKINPSDQSDTSVVIHDIPRKTYSKDENDNVGGKPRVMGVDIPVADVQVLGASAYESLPHVPNDVTLAAGTPKVEASVPEGHLMEASKDFADAYRSLTDEDRMEVLRLSYDESGSAVNPAGSRMLPREDAIAVKPSDINVCIEPELKYSSEPQLSQPNIRVVDRSLDKSVALNSNAAYKTLECEDKAHDTTVTMENETHPAKLKFHKRQKRRGSNSSKSSSDSYSYTEAVEEEKLDLTLATPSGNVALMGDSPQPELNLTIPPSPGAEIEVEADVSFNRHDIGNIPVDPLETKSEQIIYQQTEKGSDEQETLEEDGEVNMGTTLGEFEMEVPDDEEMRLELGRRLDAFIDIDLDRVETPSMDTPSLPSSVESEPEIVTVNMDRDMQFNTPQLELGTLEPGEADVTTEKKVIKGVGFDSGVMHENVNVASPTLSLDDAEEADTVRAVLKDYFGDQPSWMSKFGFTDNVQEENLSNDVSTSANAEIHSNITPSHDQEVSEASSVMQDYFDVPSLKTGSLDGQLLQQAKEEIRRRSESSSQESVSSPAASGSSSPELKAHKEFSNTVISSEMEHTSGASDNVAMPATSAGIPNVQKSAGGMAYDITTAEFKQMEPEPVLKRTSEPTGGIAYYVSIDEDKFLAVPAKAYYELEPDDNPQPPLIPAWNKEVSPSAAVDYTTSNVNEEEEDQDQDRNEEVRLQLPQEQVLHLQTPHPASQVEDVTVGLDPNIYGNGNNSSHDSTPVGSPIQSAKDFASMDAKTSDRITILEHEPRQGVFTLTVNTDEVDVSDSEA